ncbi:MAG: hypothetical protein AAF550_00895 [Myxococcota bacterium]
MKQRSISALRSRGRARNWTAIGLTFSAGLASCLIFAVVPYPTPADAQSIRAQAYLTQQRIPRNLSERSLIRFVRGHRARGLIESDEPPIAERYWHASLVVAFNRSIDDVEFHVLYYDVEAGSRRFVEDMTTMVQDRTQRTYLQRIRLRRPAFKPSRDMEMVITVRRREAGSLRFSLIGEELQRSGEVDFTDELEQ